MLREIADLGFRHVELSHGIRITLVPGILKAVEEGVLSVTSTHNFCPLPTGVTQAAPNLFEPSSGEPREHDQWLRHTKRSIDFAAQVGAKVLVTHLGSGRFFWNNPGVKLRSYLRRNRSVDVWQDAGYRRRLAKAVQRLRTGAAKEWGQVRRSLDDLREYALTKQVKIGCENREKFEELPLDEDFGALFDSLAQPHACGYWHDTGHAELKRRMGVGDNRQLLERNAERLLGFHLHDVDDAGHDHRAIGDGTVDFEEVSAFWRPHHLLTLELSPHLRTQQILKSKTALEALITKRFQ